MEIGDLIRRCFRIFTIARKPTNEELMETAKITAFGMVLLGLLGFVISILFSLI